MTAYKRLFNHRPPQDSITLYRSPSTLSALDNLLVILGSLGVIGSVLWTPLLLKGIYNYWKRHISKENKTKRRIFASLLIATAWICIVGPHRNPKVGEYLNFRHWRLWEAFVRYVSMEVRQDSCSYEKNKIDIQNDKAILSVIPHGIFPFSLGLAALSDSITKHAFCRFRPVVATATKFVPFLRMFLAWLDSVDAPKSSVHAALTSVNNNSSIGLSPGGIAEMFLAYPKPFTHPNEEYALLSSRKGFIRLALQHNLPIIPIYCFGSSQMFKQLNMFPNFFEKLSKWLRISFILFYGRWGLPIPFRTKLLYVIGKPIFPNNNDNCLIENVDDDCKVNDMHQRFCQEIQHIFDRHKESYGWADKILKIV